MQAAYAAEKVAYMPGDRLSPGMRTISRTSTKSHSMSRRRTTPNTTCNCRRRITCQFMLRALTMITTHSHQIHRREKLRRN